MGFPNLQHSDKWRLNISNMPGFVDQSQDLNNIQIYENYVKAFTFPDISLELVQSRFRNYGIHHQISPVNGDLSDISITFKVSEGLWNYYYLYDYIQSMREGLDVDPKEKFFRNDNIKALSITFLDNEKRPSTRFVFSNCFITNISSLNLTNGVDQELDFTLTLKYEDYTLEPIEEC